MRSERGHASALLAALVMTFWAAYVINAAMVGWWPYSDGYKLYDDYIQRIACERAICPTVTP